MEVMQWKLLTNKEISKEQCLSYVDNHPYGTIFHTPYMFEVYMGTPDFDLERMSQSMLKNDCKYEDHLNIIVDFSQSEDILWQQVHSKRRNEIRKAEKERCKRKEIIKWAFS